MENAPSPSNLAVISFPSPSSLASSSPPHTPKAAGGDPWSALDQDDNLGSGEVPVGNHPTGAHLGDTPTLGPVNGGSAIEGIRGGKARKGERTQGIKVEESLGSPLDSPFDSPQQQTEGSEAIVTVPHEKASSISLPPPESITTNDQSELKSPKKDGRGRRNSEGKRRKSNKIAASSSTASIDDRGLISHILILIFDLDK